MEETAGTQVAPEIKPPRKPRVRKPKPERKPRVMGDLAVFEVVLAPLSSPEGGLAVETYRKVDLDGARFADISALDRYIRTKLPAGMYLRVRGYGVRVLKIETAEVRKLE